MLRVSEQGEHPLLTIADTGPEKGAITVVYLVTGKSTMPLEVLSEGDSILDAADPLGKATYIIKSDSVICVGGGTGIAAMHHIAKGHHKVGNYVVAIIDAHSKDLLLFENELKSFCDKVFTLTDGGGHGHKGFVTDLLEDRLEEDKKVQKVVAVDLVPMM